MTPLIKQVYSLMLKNSSIGSIHISFKKEIIDFIRKYKIKSPVMVKDNNGEKVHLHFLLKNV